MYLVISITNRRKKSEEKTKEDPSRHKHGQQSNSKQETKRRVSSHKERKPICSLTAIYTTNFQ